MKIVVGSDHAGFELKKYIAEFLQKEGYEVIDKGTFNGEESVDYPDYGFAVGEEVAASKGAKGILVCGSGIGISIAANKVKGIRAALCHNEESAKLSRMHNDANILVLSGRPISEEKKQEAHKLVEIWLATAFEGGRHQKRVFKLDNYKS